MHSLLSYFPEWCDRNNSVSYMRRDRARTDGFVYISQTAERLCWSCQLRSDVSTRVTRHSARPRHGQTLAELNDELKFERRNGWVMSADATRSCALCLCVAHTTRLQGGPKIASHRRIIICHKKCEQFCAVQEVECAVQKGKKSLKCFSPDVEF